VKEVLDAGPIIHLNQVGKLSVLEFLDEVYTSDEVAGEVGRDIIESTDIEVKELNPSAKDKAKYISSRNGIELGESTALALAQQVGAGIFFTDDLDARSTAKNLDIEPHGTLALVTRAYSMEAITQEKAVEAVEDLYQDSSLFITRDLVNWAIEKIKEKD
jgi:predicted nucleic acid-binding protein